MNTILIGLYRLWKRFTGWPKAAVLEAAGMFFNDAFFLLVWYVAVSKNAVAGWGINEALLFLGSTAAGFGVAALLFGGSFRLENIVNGTFDIYFLRPQSVWLQYMTDGTSLSIFGDLVFGIALLALSTYPLHVKLLVLLSVVFVEISLATTMTGIFMALRAINTHTFTRIWNIAFSQAVWPSHALRDWTLRFLLIFVLPGLLYATLPIEVIRGEAPVWPLLAGYALWSIVPVVAWKVGLKRYTGVSGYGWMAQ